MVTVIGETTGVVLVGLEDLLVCVITDVQADITVVTEELDKEEKKEVR